MKVLSLLRVVAALVVVAEEVEAVVYAVADVVEAEEDGQHQAVINYGQQIDFTIPHQLA